VAEAAYKGERIVMIEPADIAQLHAEALVTEQLLKKLGLNVELATSEWGSAIKRINVKEPVAWLSGDAKRKPPWSYARFSPLYWFSCWRRCFPASGCSDARLLHQSIPKALWQDGAA
jgi:hypothetical protein